MNIAFFVSDHGFGHIMREIPVIKHLLDKGNNITVISNEKHISFTRRFFGEKVNYEVMHTDSGIIVIPGTIIRDSKLTAEAAETMISNYPKYISLAKEIFCKYSINRVVVDIVPWAIAAANESNIKSYLMASFTWLNQYGDCLSEWSKSVLTRCFKSASEVLYYELCNIPTKELLGQGIDIGFVSRDFNLDNVQKIKSMHKRKIVFLSIGGSNSGLDFEIDVGSLDYDFITTSFMTLKGTNVECIDINDLNTQDYIKAADYCISKPGWTTISEMMLAGTKFALLKRPDIQEDSLTIEMLEERKEAISFFVDDLKDMSYVMKKLENFIPSKRMYKNGVSTIANILSKEEE